MLLHVSHHWLFVAFVVLLELLRCHMAVPIMGSLAKAEEPGAMSSEHDTPESED